MIAVCDGGGALVAQLGLPLATPWTVAHQAPLSMGFPRQEYWNGLPFPYPEDLFNPGMEPVAPSLLVDSLLLGQQGNCCWYLII